MKVGIHSADSLVTLRVLDPHRCQVVQIVRSGFQLVAKNRGSFHPIYERLPDEYTYATPDQQSLDHNSVTNSCRPLWLWPGPKDNNPQPAKQKTLFRRDMPIIFTTSPSWDAGVLPHPLIPLVREEHFLLQVLGVGVFRWASRPMASCISSFSNAGLYLFMSAADMPAFEQ